MFRPLGQAKACTSLGWVAPTPIMVIDRLADATIMKLRVSAGRRRPIVGELAHAPTVACPG